MELHVILAAIFGATLWLTREIRKSPIHGNQSAIDKINQLNANQKATNQNMKDALKKDAEKKV